MQVNRRVGIVREVHSTAGVPQYNIFVSSDGHHFEILDVEEGRDNVFACLLIFMLEFYKIRVSLHFANKIVDRFGVIVQRSSHSSQGLESAIRIILSELFDCSDEVLPGGRDLLLERIEAEVPGFRQY